MNWYAIIKKWWSAWGTLPVYNWVKAARLYKHAQFQEAAKYYLLGLKFNFNHPASQCARLDLAYCYFRIGNFIEAEQQLRIVLSESPDCRDAAVRLYRLHAWTGNYVEAAIVLRRCLEQCPNDDELIALMSLAALENNGPAYLVSFAKAELEAIVDPDNSSPLVNVARARLAMNENRFDEAIELVEPIVNEKDPIFDALVVHGQLCLEVGRIAHARRSFRLAMALVPDHPKLLSLMARTYLKAGLYYEPDYACQLATTAAQNSGWLSPWAMHTLAEAYYHRGDNMSALILAGKAKEVGSQRLGAYRDAKILDQLIESLNQLEIA